MSAIYDDVLLLFLLQLLLKSDENYCWWNEMFMTDYWIKKKKPIFCMQKKRVNKCSSKCLPNRSIYCYYPMEYLMSKSKWKCQSINDCKLVIEEVLYMPRHSCNTLYCTTVKELTIIFFFFCLYLPMFCRLHTNLLCFCSFKILVII